MKKTNKRDVHLMSVSCCLGGQGRSPKLDSMCKSSSKHKVTEEVNFQFARRISHVATTAGYTCASRQRRYPVVYRYGKKSCIAMSHKQRSGAEPLRYVVNENLILPYIPTHPYHPDPPRRS